jgi:phosphinothricin acetyltransferase
MKIRTATVDDALGILNIYSPYIVNTSLTFESEVPSINNFSKRIGDYLQEWPWLVCEIDNQIAGYAYASRYRERVCYQWSVECSVYIHDQYMHKGIAQALYVGLMEILKIQGFRNVYAVINLPNPKSVSFHEQFGFSWFATYDHVGYKLGEWKNVGWWKLQLNNYDQHPDPLIAFSNLDKSFLPNLFKKLETKIKMA